ncbi:lipopolysaccharide heptosyltransferase I [Deefgea rivuli]|uniref:lipopolysaccharide heptosyltransferase I n=1 Tax=Deefgea rivuli TaxID=400948 RepID=UPI000482EC54|nr:lipopolysaccharide heptosyltransferase I [Deefgea rivuli]
MKRILISKLTSLGDILFVLPMISDIRRQYPKLQIDWLVDSSFAELPALHPAIDRVIAIPLRGFKKQSRRTLLRGVLNAIKTLRLAKYDLVLDCHGMIKSALLSKIARADRIIGPPTYRLGELEARFAYTSQVSPDPKLPAIEWYREYAAQALNYRPSGTPEFNLQVSLPALNLQKGRYVMAFFATSGEGKYWPMAHWLSLLQALEQHGLAAILPWGNAAEQAFAEHLAAQLKQAVVAPKLTIAQVASLISGAEWSIGVDTGMTHLAESLERATVALYTVTDSTTYHPYWKQNAHSLGGNGVIPEPVQVLAAMGL